MSLSALVLFGSRARGDALDVSDWDFAVVAPDFERLNPLERPLRILECLEPGVEFVCLTPEELLHPEMSYLRCAILEEGIPVHDDGAFERARRRYDEEKRAGRIRVRGPLVEFGEPT